MGIKNEEVLEMVVNKFKSMEGHFNIIETELKKDESEFNKPLVAISFGKMSKMYEDIAYLMGIFDGNPKYEGR
jgi:hypothetical protein